MSWREFLVGAQGPLIEAIIGFFLSFLVEWWPKWDTLEPKVKRLLMFAFCFFIPLLAKVLELVTYGGAWGDFPNTWFPMLVAGFVAFGSATLTHTRKLK